MSIDDRDAAPQAPVQTTLAAIFFSMELSRSSWLITSLSPGGGEKMSKRSIPAGDMAGLMALLGQIREKVRLRTGESYRSRPICVPSWNACSTASNCCLSR